MNFDSDEIVDKIELDLKTVKELEKNRVKPIYNPKNSEKKILSVISGPTKKDKKEKKEKKAKVALDEEFDEEFPEEIPEEPKPKEKKDDIIKRILELKQRANEPCTKSELTRYKKSELEEILGSLIENGINNINESKEEELTVNICESEQIPLDERRNISLDVAAKSLFNLNLLAGSVLSSINDAFILPHTNLSIKQLPSKLKQNERELLEIYRDIYAEYHVEVEKYISPLNKLIILNVGIISQSLETEKKE